MGQHRHTFPLRGESRPFHFDSVWHIDAPVEWAWGTLTDVGNWSNWWPGIRVIALEARGGSEGVGDRARLEARSPVGFGLVIDVELTAIESLHRMEFTSDGDLRGHGSWTCHDEGDETRMEIVWCVVSRRLPIRLSRPVAAWAHDRLMVRGEAGLQRVLTRT